MQALSVTAAYTAYFGEARQHLLTDQFLWSDSGYFFCSLTQLIVYDATEDDDSALDADSQQARLSQEDSAAHRSLGKHAISGEWADKSHGQDSSELDSKQHDWSMENDSRQKFDSHEAEDDSKAGVRGDSNQSMESRESQVHVSAEIPDDNSNQTLESAEDAQDHHSIENNEVTL